MKYRINTELTPENYADFALFGDESFEYGDELHDSLAACVRSAESSTGLTLAEIGAESYSGGIDVKIVGRDIW